MKHCITLAIFVCLLASVALAQDPRDGQDPAQSVSEEKVLTKAGNGTVILHPTSRKTYAVKDGDRTLQVPEMMVYVPGGPSKIGSGKGEGTVTLDGYCIGKFSVTNAEYREFIAATGHRPPSYWKAGSYPEGKASHPVAFVSLTDAKAYANWVSEKTGWNVAVPTSHQWEKAARGPKGFLYPWGDTMDVTYRDGVLKSKFSFNAVTTAQFLRDEPKRVVTYNNKKSPHFGKTTTVEKIAGYRGDQPTYLSVGPNGSVRGWVSHETYTGFIYTDLFTSLNEKGGNTVPVGSYEDGKSGYGCYDMAGNVWNWCDTLITATNGAEQGKKVNEIRGGSWYANGTSCKSVSIGEGREGRGAYNTVGFRIVMVPAVK